MVQGSRGCTVLCRRWAIAHSIFDVTDYLLERRKNLLNSMHQALFRLPTGKEAMQ
jgi:hypothetical protein